MYIPSVKVSVICDGGNKVDLRPTMDCPSKVAELAREIVGHDEREHLLVFILDARSKVKSYTIVSIGTISASLVHPREVFRAAIVAGGAGIIVAHNHPSGDANPSADDRDSTRRMVRAGEIIGIPVVDHVIFTDTADGSMFSFKEHGLMGV